MKVTEVGFMEKKYQVFISSTYDDLKDERSKIIEILLSADCIPAGMEAFVATDNEQFNVIKTVIDLCDYYILLLGNRYGSTNQSTSLSYTEMEYNYAKSQGIPVLVFAKEPRENEHNESDDSQRKLDSFRKNALDNRLGSIYANSADLQGKVAVSIMKAIKEIPRAGWQPATDYDEAELRKQVMELEQENHEYQKRIEILRKQLMRFTDDHAEPLAFEGGEIELTATIHKSGAYIHPGQKFTINFKDLFDGLSKFLFVQRATHHKIDKFICSYLIDREGYNKSNMSISLDNQTQVTEILLQYEGLNLIERVWTKEKRVLLWQLTDKGVKTMKDMTLVKK